MPIYEYRCTACGFQNDYLQKISEPQLSDCPACGKDTFAKQVTAAGFQLKGTGWYATDFKNKGAAPKNGSGKDEGKSAESAASEGGAKPDAPACGAGACPACT
jgi:putative FmdB family regulatory protein